MKNMTFSIKILALVCFGSLAAGALASVYALEYIALEKVSTSTIALEGTQCPKPIHSAHDALRSQAEDGAPMMIAGCGGVF